MTDNLKLPIGLDIHVTREGDLARMEYREKFAPADAAAFGLSVDFAKQQGLDIHLEGNTIVWHLTDTPERIGDVLVGEALFWSTLGRMSIRELISSIAISQQINPKVK